MEPLPALDCRWCLAARAGGAAVREADRDGRLDWVTHYVDGTIVRAHQHTAGAVGGQHHEEALGWSRGGFSTKVHLRAAGGGKPVAFVLSGGRAAGLSDSWATAATATRGCGVPSPGEASGPLSHAARISGRAIGPGTLPLDRAAYRERNHVERLVNRLKQCRRIATCYEKHAAHYLAMLTLGACILWL